MTDSTQDKPAVGPHSAGEWTKHNGSCVQLRGQRVDVRKADGSEWLDWIADQWGLDWIWHRAEERAPSDIVEFRPARLAPTAPVCAECKDKGFVEYEGGDGEGYPSRVETEDCPKCSAAPVETVGETVSPEGLRARANIVRGQLNDSGSCARHLELAADEIERLLSALPTQPDTGKVVTGQVCATQDRPCPPHIGACPMPCTGKVEAGGSEDKQATSGAGLVANLASYCGGETPGCTDVSPCCDCLKMANVFERGADPFGAYVAQLGDLLRPQQEPTT